MGKDFIDNPAFGIYNEQEESARPNRHGINNLIPEEIENIHNQDEIRQFLKYLSPREEEVFKKLFGLFGEEQMNMAEIGRKFNVSRSGILSIYRRGRWRIKNKRPFKTF